MIADEEKTVGIPAEAMSHNIAGDAEVTELRQDAYLAASQPQHAVDARWPALLIVAAAKGEDGMGESFVSERKGDSICEEDTEGGAIVLVLDLVIALIIVLAPGVVLRRFMQSHAQWVSARHQPVHRRLERRMRTLQV